MVSRLRAHFPGVQGVQLAGVDRRFHNQLAGAVLFLGPAEQVDQDVEFFRRVVGNYAEFYGKVGVSGFGFSPVMLDVGVGVVILGMMWL